MAEKEKEDTGKIKCPSCKTEVEVSRVLCPSCGAFVTQKEISSKLLKPMNSRYPDPDSWIYLLDEHPAFKGGDKPVLPSPSLKVDGIVGGGGFPVSAIVELAGDSGSGKSTFAYQQIGNVQSRGGSCLLVDMEHAFGLKYGKRMGIDTSLLSVAQPGNGTEAIDMIGENCDKYDFIVLDSVSALSRAESVTKVQKIDPKTKELKSSNEIAGISRLLGDLQNKFLPRIKKSNCTIFLINQFRENINPYGSGGQITPGGNPIKYLCSHRVWFRKQFGKDGQILQGGNKIGFKVKAQCVKSRTGSEGGITDLSFIYYKGFDRMREYLDLAIQYQLVTQNGSWYNYGGEKLGQGYEGAYETFCTNKEINAALSKLVSEKFAKEEFEVEGIEDYEIE